MSFPLHVLFPLATMWIVPSATVGVLAGFGAIVAARSGWRKKLAALIVWST